MNLTVFSCSTGFHSYPDPNKDYIGKLSLEQNIKGRWMDGMAILDVKRELPTQLCGNDRAVILHIGAVEAFSYRSANVIEWCAEYFLRNPSDQYAMNFLIPKILKASHSLTHKQDLFLSILEPEEFVFILQQVLHILQGTKVIMMGMSKPNTPDKLFWVEQAFKFNQILEEEAKTANASFVDVWNLCSQYVVDNNHLNEEGHNVLYKTIKEILK